MKCIGCRFEVQYPKKLCLFEKFEGDFEMENPKIHLRNCLYSSRLSTKFERISEENVKE